MKSLPIRSWAASLMALCFACSCASGDAAAVQATALLCEYRENPLGIDVVAPRLSWRSEDGGRRSEVRGVRQAAYQILVASSAELLARDEGDLWDSGKVESDQSLQIEYAGVPLESRMLCHWKVRVWTDSALNPDPRPLNPSSWSAPALWTMGLLEPDDWSAQWIGYDAAYDLSEEEQADDRLLNIGGLGWVQIPGAHGRESVDTGFRRLVELPADRALRRAVLVLYAFHYCEASVNGTPVGTAAFWEQTSRLDVTDALRAGDNVVSLVVEQTDPHRPAVIGRLVMQFEAGPDVIVPVDQTWKVSQDLPAGWDGLDFDDSAWPAAERLGGQPWNGPPPVADLKRLPAPYLRRGFDVDQPVRRATVYVTALGTYELRLNGERVSEDVFAPGWTDFHQRVHYQTYDVTHQVRQGDNVIGAILGDGWYASNLAHLARRKIYGGNPRLLVQLEIERADGRVQTVVSDGDWKAAYGPIRHADLQIGCEYDARLEMPGWDRTGFDAGAWAPVIAGTQEPQRMDVTSRLAAAVQADRIDLQVTNDTMGGDPVQGVQKVLVVSYERDGEAGEVTVGENQRLRLEGPGLKILHAAYGRPSPGRNPFRLQASLVEPSRVINELPAVRLTEPRPGRWTFDLGQNMVGWVRLKVRGEPGQRITLRHGEMLNADGTVYTAALRSCPATDFFILAGEGEEVLEPYFTFHGFQYLEITGLTSPPELEDVTGIVVHTPMRRTGHFESSHALLNQLYSNIIWGQKGNFLEVPTDCPQRDERMGWTGDTQFFAPTALYNFDGAAFYTRWLENCEDGQYPDGAFPHVIPRIHEGGGATGWGDAALICTHLMYRAYADTRIIEERFAAMERYMDWLAVRVNAEGITHVGGFGDWLNAGSSAPAPVMDTAYHAYLARIMSEMAAAIGRDEDAARYARRHEEVKAAFVRAFFNPDGSLKNCGQTGYALAFTMDLVPEELRAQAAEQYVESVRRHNWHLGTGFIGTPRLLPGLNRAGRDDVAYRLLLTDTYPSWLFPVKNGATTMWERWNGWTPDQGFGPVQMNSFNHYAFGAVGEYLYGGVGGIQATSPGYKTILIRPAVPGTDWDERTVELNWANTSFDSPHGPIVSHWRLDGEALTMEIEIPVNTTAEVHVPAQADAAVNESGRPAAEAPGVTFLRMENGAAVYAVGSGVYAFHRAPADF